MTISLSQLALFLGALLPTVFAAPHIQERTTIPGRYIVSLKSDSDLDLSSHLAWVSHAHGRSSIKRDTIGVERQYSIDTWQAYSGEFDDETIELIRSNPEVDSVATDVYMSYADASRESVREHDCFTQRDAPYGLEIISSRSPGNKGYKYDQSAGEDTYAYVVDTGILVTHDEFEGRASMGYSVFPGNMEDEDGHGTHVAGTIAGKTYGVSKKSNVIGVKVFGGVDAVTPESKILEGFNWAVNDIVNKNRTDRSVINLSIVNGEKTWIKAVNAAYKRGVLSVAAAGNGGMLGMGWPAEENFPGGVTNAITVGAIDEYWKMAGFSNYGPIVDLLAPGVDVLSAGIEINSTKALRSGTSMTTPHIAGLALYWKDLKGLKSPKETTDYLLKLTTQNMVTRDLKGTPNKVAYNGCGILKSDDED